MMLLIQICILIFVSVIGLAAFLWWLSKKSALPNDAPIGCNISRNVETVLFSLTLLMIFIYLLTQRAGGLLLKLDELRPQFAMVYLVLAGIVLLILAATVVIAYFRQTMWAVCVASVIIFAYAWILDGPFDLLHRLVNLFY